MKELFLYSIFAIILYFILSIIFDNFNIEQENFDSSLVPVSSIISLAKIAQKLVNGNGTLTNPGNLQIGASTATPGNLTVTGNSIITGNLSIAGTTNFNGPVTFGTGNSTIPGSLTTKGSLTSGSSSNLQSIQTWGPIISNSLTVGPGAAQFNGPVTTNTNLTTTSITQGGLHMRPGTASFDATIFGFGDGTGWRTRIGKANSPTLDIYDNGTVTINGAANTTGNVKSKTLDVTNLTIGGVDIVAKLASLESKSNTAQNWITNLNWIDTYITKVRRLRYGDTVTLKRMSDGKYLYGDNTGGYSGWAKFVIYKA
jgi:hypothetical protein